MSSHRVHSVALLAITLAMTASLTAEEAGRTTARERAAAGVGMFSSKATPRERAVPDERRTSLGVRFTSKRPGTVKSVQFFRSSKNRGHQRVRLWSRRGVLLGRGTYRGNDTGWVTVRLRKAVPIKAHTPYVASYVAPRGRYSRTRNVEFPVRTHGLTARRGLRSHGRGMPRHESLTNYFVDVVFKAGTTTSPTTSTPTVTPGVSVLPLPRVPWEGGPAYWSQFPKARQAGWDQAGFFPISVFLSPPDRAAELKALGINTYMGVEHNPPLSQATNHGMFVLPQQEEWTQAEVGNNPNAVGWLISDECEMGYSGCGDDEQTRLATQQQYVDKVDAYQDGRFKHANFGNGILRTYWAPNTMDEHVQLMDAASADKYAYTSPHNWELIPTSPDWPKGARVDTAAAYGWQVDQMRRFQRASDLRPIWTFVETAMPFLTEQGARTITPDQIEGAVWSAIIHEARGIAFFQHNNNGECGTYSLLDCGSALRAQVKELTSKIRDLAPVINSQSYAYNFSNGTDTMLKATASHAYIFAGVGLLQSPGTKTFALPPGVTGTSVTVVGEGRAIPVTDGKFSDEFAAEHTHHVYRVAL